MLPVPMLALICSLPDWSASLVTSKISLSSLSLTGAAHSQDQDFYVDQYSEATSATQPMEEEGKITDRKSTKPERNLDQDVREEQTFRETVREIKSFMGWKQVPEFESLSSSLDDCPFAGTKTQATGKVSV